jgi:Ca2+-binding RTX toxin-like protein
MNPYGGMSFVGNLSNNSSQVVIFAGRPDTSISPSSWSPQLLHLFEWVNNDWKETTSNRFNNDSNQIIGTTHVFFADYNGDGKVDLISPTFTDANSDGVIYYWKNTGEHFVKQQIDVDNESHGAYVSDLNKDGFADLIVSWAPNPGIALGTPDGLQWHKDYLPGASICVGDFLGDGSVSIVSTDYPKNLTFYSVLWSLSFDANNNPQIKFVADLPTPRFQLNKWSSYNFGPQGEAISTPSHNCQSFAMDFNSDGLMDVVIISRPNLTNNSTWPFYSEVQFCKNTGNGQFVDVTDSVLVGYNNNSSACYQPLVGDFNGDGLQDIFLSQGDHVGYVSTSLLIQSPNGQFLDTGRSQFSKLFQDCIQKTKPLVSNGFAPGIVNGGGPMTIAKGGDGKYYVFTNITYLSDNATSTKEIIYATPLSILLTENSFVPPTIAVSTNDISLTVGETATISFTLSETSSDFELADVTASGGTLSNFSGSGISYTALFTPTPNSTTNAVLIVTSSKFTDAAGNNNTASNSVTMTVNTVLANSNNAPTAKTATLAAKKATEGSAFSYTLDSKQFSDADKDALTISATLQDNSTIPSWLTFNPTTKKLTGTPGYAAADNSSITIKFTADDGRGGTTFSTMVLNISNKATITGTSKADTIIAGAGNDTVNGGLGSDTLTGGLGNDTFVFNTKLGPANIDTITDFTSGDKIALAGSIFSKLKGDKDLSDNLYVQTIVGISTQDNNDYLFYDFESGRLYYDADGSGTKSKPIEVAIIGTGGVSLTANDFSIV